MKRLLVLTAVALLTAASAGCNCFGSREVAQQCNSCDQCDTGAGFSDPYLPGPMMTMPGPVYSQ